MRATVFALAIAALLTGNALPAVSARAADGPEAVIAAIYKRVAAGKGESGGQFVWLEKKDRARYLSASLAALWNAEDAKTPPGDEGPPGFDPVSNSQDPKVRNVAVTLEKSDAGRATVAASFDSWSPRQHPRGAGAQSAGPQGAPHRALRHGARTRLLAHRRYPRRPRRQAVVDPRHHQGL